MEKPSFNVTSEFTAKYGSGQATAILLHGYQQDAGSICNMLFPVLKSQFAMIYSVDGPFPVPFEKNGQWNRGFSWYFYDRTTDHFFVDMQTAVSGLSRFIDELPCEEVTLLGYSQGGYLIPFLANQNTKVVRGIGINCRYRVESLNIQRSFTLDSIHAKDDLMVDFDRSRKCFDELMEKSNASLQGEFIEVKGGHRIGPPVLDALAGLVGEPN